MVEKNAVQLVYLGLLMKRALEYNDFLCLILSPFG